MEHLVREFDFVFLGKSIEGTKCRLTESLGTGRVQTDVSLGLKLKPPDDVHNPLKRSVRPQYGFFGPTMVPVEGNDLRVAVLGEVESLEKGPHGIFPNVNVGYVEVSEKVGSVFFVVSVQNVVDNLSMIENGSVNVKENDEFLLASFLVVEPVEVSGKCDHPAIHRSNLPLV